MIVPGTLFHINGKDYAYVDLSEQGNVIAYRMEDIERGDPKPRRFNGRLTIDRVFENAIGGESQEAVDHYEEYLVKKHTAMNRANALQEGDEFVAQGQRFKTIKVNRKNVRAVCLDDDLTYDVPKAIITNIGESNE